ncbi:MAG: RHS repeat-associated core domain-containing protein [Vulcanimicrobiota bacterium]
MSRRTKITEYTNGTMTSKKLYFWLGGSIVCERDGMQTGFPITKQYFGQGEVRGATKLYYTFDHLGSIRELVDSAGTVQAEYSYSTYGERTKASGNLDSDWGYAGLWHHQASGLDLATYRAYDAANKRWISRDPLGEGVDTNLYRYCGNNPISCADPSGLETEALGGIKVQVKDGKTVITTDISLTRSSQLPAIVKGRLHVKVRKRCSEGVMDSEGRSGIWYPVGDYTTKPQVIGPGGSAKQELELNGIKPEFDQIDIVFEFDATAVGAIAPMQEVPGREFSRATFPLVNGYPDLAHPTDEYPPNGNPARSSSPTNPRIPPRPRGL